MFGARRGYCVIVVVVAQLLSWSSVSLAQQDKEKEEWSDTYGEPSEGQKVVVKRYGDHAEVEGKDKDQAPIRLDLKDHAVLILVDPSKPAAVIGGTILVFGHGDLGGDTGPFEHGFDITLSDANHRSVLKYGPFILVVFQPGVALDCDEIRYVQFRKFKQVVKRPGLDDDVQERGWGFDADPDELSAGNPSYPGEATTETGGEEGAFDGPGESIEWVKDKKGTDDDQVDYPTGSVLETTREYRLWIVCLHKGGNAELLGVVEWGFTMTVTIGENSQETRQSVKPIPPKIHQSGDEGYQELEDQYKASMTGPFPDAPLFPEYLPE